MNPLIIPAVIEAIKSVLDRVIPDENAREQAKRALDSEVAVQHFQIALAQIGVNLEEVRSGHWLGKWRGALGWGAVAAMLYQLIVYPFMIALILIFDEKFPVERLPVLEWKQLGQLLMGLLGLG